MIKHDINLIQGSKWPHAANLGLADDPNHPAIGILIRFYYFYAYRTTYAIQFFDDYANHTQFIPLENIEQFAQWLHSPYASNPYALDNFTNGMHLTCYIISILN